MLADGHLHVAVTLHVTLARVILVTGDHGEEGEEKDVLEHGDGVEKRSGEGVEKRSVEYRLWNGAKFFLDIIII